MDQEITKQSRSGFERRPSRLRLTYGPTVIVLGEARRSVGFGRAPGNDFELRDEVVSRSHGSIRYKNGQFYLTDDSTNGTVLVRPDGTRLSVHQEAVLLDGAGELRLGGAEGPGFEFEVESLDADGEKWAAREPEANDPVQSPADQARYAFRKEGEYWTLVFDGTVIRLPDLRGLRFLHHLIRHPGQEFHALDLVQIATDSALPTPEKNPSWEESESMHVDQSDGAGPLLDPEAKRAYRQRLGELRDDLLEAEENNDRGRMEAVRNEIAFIEQQLSGAVGLGGRDREAASNAERARVSVTVRIREVVKRLCHHHPSLGQHLQRCIRTGRVCSYEPDPLQPITWDD